MAYKPNPNHSGTERDKSYPSEVASQRPKLVTRIHCEESPVEEAEDTVRTDTNRVDRFNSQLRSGHRLNDNTDIPDDGS